METGKRRASHCRKVLRKGKACSPVSIRRFVSQSGGRSWPVQQMLNLRISSPSTKLRQIDIQDTDTSAIILIINRSAPRCYGEMPRSDHGGVPAFLAKNSSFLAFHLKTRRSRLFAVLVVGPVSLQRVFVHEGVGHAVHVHVLV